MYPSQDPDHAQKDICLVNEQHAAPTSSDVQYRQRSSVHDVRVDTKFAGAHHVDRMTFPFRDNHCSQSFSNSIRSDKQADQASAFILHEITEGFFVLSVCFHQSMDQLASLFLHVELLEGFIVPLDVCSSSTMRWPQVFWKAEVVDAMSTDKQLSFLEVLNLD